MKKILISLFLAPLVAVGGTLMVESTGVLKSPTNFFLLNSNLINQVVDAQSKLNTNGNGQFLTNLPGPVLSDDYSLPSANNGDAAPGIQAMINATLALNKRELYLGPGTYRLDSTLVITNAVGFNLRGASEYRTTLVGNFAGPVIRADGIWFSSFQDLRILQQVGHTNALIKLQRGTGINNVQSVKFVNIVFDTDYAAAYCVKINDGANDDTMGSENGFYNCHFFGATNAGLAIYGYNALNNRVYAGQFGNCTNYGIYVDGGSVDCFGVNFQNTAYNKMDVQLVNGAAYPSSFYACRSESLQALSGGNQHVTIQGWTITPGVPHWSYLVGTNVNSYALSNLVEKAGNEKDVLYRCVVAGTPGTNEPTWGAETVVDGGVTWQRVDDTVFTLNRGGLISGCQIFYGRVQALETVKMSGNRFTRNDYLATYSRPMEDGNWVWDNVAEIQTIPNKGRVVALSYTNRFDWGADTNSYNYAKRYYEDGVRIGIAKSNGFATNFNVFGSLTLTTNENTTALTINGRTLTYANNLSANNDVGHYLTSKAYPAANVQNVGLWSYLTEDAGGAGSTMIGHNNTVYANASAPANDFLVNQFLDTAKSSANQTLSMRGIQAHSRIYGGSVVNRYGVYIQNPELSGGTLGTQYGIYVEPLSGASSANYGVYSDGVASNYFGGPTLFNGTLTATNVTITGSTTARSVSATNLTAGTVTVTNALTLLNPAWRDVVKDPQSFNVGGTAIDMVPLYPGSPILVHGWDINTAGHLKIQLNHDAAVTNSVFPAFYIEPHVHISVTNITATLTNATFKIDYVWARINDKWTNSASGSITNTIALTPHQHHIMEIGSITNNLISGSISSIIEIKLTRITSATGDVNTEKVRVHDFDIHYPVNRLGSSAATSY